MTKWYRLNVDVRCGLCGSPIAAEKPVKVIQIASVKRPKFRGECCEGQAPADIPRRTEPRPRGPQPLPFATLRDAGPAIFDSLDVKQRAAGQD